jgi:hypothetical protein
LHPFINKGYGNTVLLAWWLEQRLKTSCISGTGAAHQASKFMWHCNKNFSILKS